MYRFLRPLLFRLDPEAAHNVVLRGLALAGGSAGARRLLDLAYAPRDPRLAVECFGLRFPNPVGLAAGLDKDGVAAAGLAALGFGHLELGSVTALAQPGNPHPRLFRLPEDEALINRMGFNNRSAAALAQRLERLRASGLQLPPIGVNVGKSRAAPLEDAILDYDASLRAVWRVGDFLTLNVSSPNTAGLRTLQGRGPLNALLEHVAALRRELGPRPVLLKIAPDLDEAELATVAEAAERSGIDGIIATNTTIERPPLRSVHAAEAGGLSGAPLRERSLRVLRSLRRMTRLPLISVGGIADADEALRRLESGASLVQLYTGFVYRGPVVLRDIAQGMSAALEAAGSGSLAELHAQVGRNASPDPAAPASAAAQA